MKYTTSLKGLELYAYHGLYEEEKILGAIFLVDVSVVCEIDKPITTIGEATNYELMYAAAKEEMSIRQDLIETVAQKILANIKHHFPIAEKVEVTIHKPNPAGVFKSGVASVTVSD